MEISILHTKNHYLSRKKEATKEDWHLLFLYLIG